MLKYVSIISITICLCFIISNANAPEISVSQISYEVPEILDINDTIETKKLEVFYVAKDLDGYVAIFVPDNILPFMTTDINVKTLPVAEQEMLKTGLIIDENYGLAEFIEDYSS